ncbi:hypothetical protein [Acrocarpospora pleiomorpha]|nr:hypothetical protein [Acrocarpospora pleiomorpha]
MDDRAEIQAFLSSGLTLVVYTAAPGTPSADSLRLLATWSATQDHAQPQDQRDLGTRGWG